MSVVQVCNHPELFERADVVAPFSFCTFGQSGNLAREGDILYCPDSTRNPIRVTLPLLLERDGGLLSLPGERSRAGFETRWFKNFMNVWAGEWISRARREGGQFFSFRVHALSANVYPTGSGFGFVSFLGLGEEEVQDVWKSSNLERLVWAARQEAKHREFTGISGCVYPIVEYGND